MMVEALSPFSLLVALLDRTCAAGVSKKVQLVREAALERQEE